MSPAGRETALLEVEDLLVSFPKRRTLVEVVQRRPHAEVRAVDGVSLTVRAGETLGLVGESGSGKTTLGRALLGLYRPKRGRIRFDGRDLAALEGSDRRARQRHMQMVFQDPYSSLNPRFTVRQTLAEVLRYHRVCASEAVGGEVGRLLQRVGLSAELADRRPHALSGGQRQRVGLARAIAVRPTFLVLDEPVAALDVSIQAQILNLLRDLRDELGLTMLLIAHELSVVRHMSDRVAVMYLGRIVEVGATEEIFERPHHPYTQGLLRAVPRLVARRRQRKAVLEGEVPSPLDVPPGCAFHPRCPLAQDICRELAPVAIGVGDCHRCACHFAGKAAIMFTPDEGGPHV